MKTIVKLVLTVIIINAAFRAGDAAWSFYALKDAAQQAVIFGAGSTTDHLQEQIVKRAGELELPVAPENVVVTRDGATTAAKVAYRQEIELFPRYKYPYDFKFDVDGIAVNPATAPDATKR
jgi:hypothetical protein